MVDEKLLDDRKKDIPTIDQVTTIIWTKTMGERLAIVRMKLLKDQAELGKDLGISQGMVSRIESGYLTVTERVTLETIRRVLGNHFGFVVFGSGEHRYNLNVIHKVYWDTRLRVRRKNRSLYSRPREN